MSNFFSQKQEMEPRDPESILNFPIWTFLFGGVLTSAIFLGIGLYYSQFYVIEKTWNDTPAVVTTSEVVRRRSNLRGSYNFPNIQYEYFLNEMKYSGFLSEIYGKRYPWLEDAVLRHPPGTSIIVKVNPNNSEESFWSLEGSQSYFIFLFVIAGAGFMLLFLFLGIKGLVARRKIKNYLSKGITMEEIKKIWNEPKMR